MNLWCWICGSVCDQQDFTVLFTQEPETLPDSLVSALEEIQNDVLSITMTTLSSPTGAAPDANTKRMRGDSLSLLGDELISPQADPIDVLSAITPDLVQSMEQELQQQALKR